jgi:plastocyanin
MKHQSERKRNEAFAMRSRTVPGIALTIVAAIVAIALAGCGAGSSTSSSTLTMNADSFVGGTTVTIKAGASVTFVDQSGGATHFLTIGSNGAHQDQQGEPSELSSQHGMEIDAGQTVHVTFSAPGTYHITCTIHPTMNATVIVQS